MEALDRAVAPVRRVVAWAIGDLDQRLVSVRFLGAIGGSRLRQAAALDLPGPVRVLVEESAGLLEGFDAARVEDRVQRMRVLHQGLARIDALLGLPLAGRRLERVPRRRAPPAPRQRRPEPSKEPAPPRAPRPPPFWDGTFETPLADLEIDGALGQALSGAGIETVGDLLMRRPVAVEVLRPIHGAGRDLPEGRVAVGGRVGCRYTILRPGEPSRAGLLLRGAGWVHAWRSPSAVLPALRDAERVVLVGNASEQRLEIEEVASGQRAVRLVRYAIEGIDDRAVRALVRRLLPLVSGVRDRVPGDIVAAAGLPLLPKAIETLHTRGLENLSPARDRFAFDEALLAQLGLAWARYAATRDRGIPHSVLHERASLLGDALALSDEQQLALDDIKRDLRAGIPMRRVLVGELGTGRSRVVMHAITMVAASKGQVLFVSPDVAAAEQRYALAEPALRESGLVARLLASEPRKTMRDAMGRGEVHVAFGPIALLEKDIAFRRLGLVVVEESERFGAGAATVGGYRFPQPHALFVPATPIGLEVSLTAYADCDVTVVGDAGRRPVAVEVMDAGARAEAYARARAEVDKGRQALVAFPMVRGGDALDIGEAMRVVHALEGDAFAGKKVALYHGGTSREERNRVYESFRHRRCDVLVATHLVEDGPTVPGASIVVVEQADRVDPTRLRRIRGFVSRSDHDAHVVMVVGEMADAGAVARLLTLMEAPDGFAVHQVLLAEQGRAAMVHEGAPGLPSFAWLDLASDRELAWRARAHAHRLLKNEPGLRRGPSFELAIWLRARWDAMWPDGPECPVSAGPSERRRRRRRRRRRS